MELSRHISASWQKAVEDGHDKVVLLCDVHVRPHLAAMFTRQIPQLPVLAYAEIALGTEIQSVETISSETLKAEPVGTIA